MHPYSLSHLSDRSLLHDLAALVARDRTITAALLAHLAEVDERRLYLPAAYPSMYAYCVHELRLSEDSAYKRIQAARAARQFPAIFAAVAEGRLHLSAVCLLAPYMTPDNAAELLEAAAGRTKSEIEGLLAERFPRSEMLPMVQALPASPLVTHAQLAPAQVEGHTPGQNEAITDQLTSQSVPAAAPRPNVAAVAAERFLWQLTVGRSAQEKLQYAQELLGHQIPSGDVAAVLERALDALIPQLEKTKFAATTKPRSSQPRSTAGRRHIPAYVKRAVWERDGGQCTFTSATGHRCPARSRLEFDHLDAVARGGEATVSGIRLRCRSHNYYAAECVFGAAFMETKRQQARRLGVERRARQARERAATEAAERAKEKDVIPWLRALGYSADQARRAAAGCDAIPDATLEERVRLALSCLRPPHRRVGPVAAT